MSVELQFESVFLNRCSAETLGFPLETDRLKHFLSSFILFVILLYTYGMLLENFFFFF